MDQNRKGEIAFALLKFYLRQEGITISPNKVREMVNLSKATGIPVEDLKEFALPLIHEFVDDCFVTRQ